jgi:hypothetical protein
MMQCDTEVTQTQDLGTALIHVGQHAVHGAIVLIATASDCCSWITTIPL